MGSIKLDETKCERDGICVAICPMGLFRQKEAGKVPTHKPDARHFCIDCYHCIAACPHEALTIGSVDASNCEPLDEEMKISQEEAEQFLRSRRSIRSYKEKAVEKETITGLIELASHAPSGHNNRDLRWTVYYHPDDVQHLSAQVIDWARYEMTNQPELAKKFYLDRLVKGWDLGIDTICHNAPHLIVVHASKSNPMARQAATIAINYLELAAISMGLGTCWAGYFQMAVGAWKPLREKLSLSKDEAVHGALMIGYPKYSYHRLPPRPKPDVSYV